MKLVKKSDLTFLDGMLLDKDGTIVTVEGLADEVNEIIDLSELIGFAKLNAAKIEARTDKPIEFVPTRAPKAKLTLGKEMPTPLNDAFKAECAARAEEFLNAQSYADVDDHLARYGTLAAWLDKDYVFVSHFENDVVEPMRSNPLDITEADVVGIVAMYHDPDIRKLIAGITVLPS